jgi:hypothetical protein
VALLEGLQPGFALLQGLAFLFNILLVSPFLFPLTTLFAAASAYYHFKNPLNQWAIVVSCVANLSIFCYTQPSSIVNLIINAFRTK